MQPSKEHSFIVCAYRESPYLEECIQSLIHQKVPSETAIATSTPSEFLSDIAGKYGIPLFINTGEKGIAGDWNFALSCATTPFVTLAHQDDVYLPEYSKEAIRALKDADNPILFCSNYGELRDGKTVHSGVLIRTKQLMTAPMRMFPQSKNARTFALAFGNGICCPTVTYVSDVIRQRPFQTGMKSNLDWERWTELSRLKGSFVYCPKPLVLHRIHAGAETSRLIGENARTEEDYEMFLNFHSRPVARLLARIYANGERAYKS